MNASIECRRFSGLHDEGEQGLVRRFVAYVDEAGDEGFGKLAGEGPTGQSRWFILGACVVDETSDRLLPAWKSEILRLFPKRQSTDIHFRDFNHEQKVQIALALSENRWAYAPSRPIRSPC